MGSLLLALVWCASVVTMQPRAIAARLSARSKVRARGGGGQVREVVECALREQ